MKNKRYFLKEEYAAYMLVFLCGCAGEQAENDDTDFFRFLFLMILWSIWFLYLYIKDDAE
jgi:hypothetical protein